MRAICTQADVVWLEYEALPWFPWGIERRFWPNIPVVTDYDDAIFHRYDQNQHLLVRNILGRKIDSVMRASTVVIAGNGYLAEHTKKAGAKRVETVPTVVDTEVYQVSRAQRDDNRIRIGWIGIPETWTRFASDFTQKIERTIQKNSLIFRVIGAESAPRAEGVYEFLPWSEKTEATLINGMDIGLMPLPDTPWTRGKCGYKLIQYMACGLPVVASPVGVNKEIVEHGVNGFLAETEEEWRSAIETLLSDAELRCRMATAGRKKLEKNYSLRAWGPRVAQMLRQVADQSRSA